MAKKRRSGGFGLAAKSSIPHKAKRVIGLCCSLVALTGFFAELLFTISKKHFVPFSVDAIDQ